LFSQFFIVLVKLFASEPIMIPNVDPEAPHSEFFSCDDASSSEMNSQNIRDDKIHDNEYNHLVLEISKLTSPPSYKIPKVDESSSEPEDFASFSSSSGESSFKLESLNILPSLDLQDPVPVQLPSLGCCIDNCCLCICCFCVFYFPSRPLPHEIEKRDRCIFNSSYFLKRGFHTFYKSFFFVLIIASLYIVSIWIYQVIFLIGCLTCINNLNRFYKREIRGADAEFSSYFNPDRNSWMAHPIQFWHWDDCLPILSCCKNCCTKCLICWCNSRCCKFTTCFGLSSLNAYQEGSVRPYFRQESWDLER